MNIEDSNRIKERDYLFDNFRALLIFLTVLGHMLTEQLGKIYSIDTVYYFIYFFHMPAFIFISGYFSKNVEKSRNTAVQSFFIPYLVLNGAIWFRNRMLYGATDPFHIFDPEWAMWFLLSMFVWKYILKDLIRIRYILPLSFIFGIVSGFSSEFSLKFSLARIITFLPFFLLGYYFNEKHILFIRKIPKMVSVVILSGIGVFAYYSNKYDIIKKELLYMRKAYDKVKDGMINDVLARFLVYFIAVLMIICFINLFSKAETWFSLIGQNSITVYVLHIFAVYQLRTYNLPWNGTIYFIFYAAIVSVVFTYLFSRPVVVRGYNLFMNNITSLILKPIQRNKI